MEACVSVGPVPYPPRSLVPVRRVGVLIHGLRTVSTANAREHWRARAERSRNERAAVRAHFQHEQIAPLEFGETCVVKLTRIGPARMDSDNVIGSFKAIRDQVADCLGVDDGDEATIVFKYAREKGEFAVRIELEVA